MVGLSMGSAKLKSMLFFPHEDNKTSRVMKNQKRGCAFMDLVPLVHNDYPFCDDPFLARNGKEIHTVRQVVGLIGVALLFKVIV